MGARLKPSKVIHCCQRRRTTRLGSMAAHVHVSFSRHKYTFIHVDQKIVGTNTRPAHARVVRVCDHVLRGTSHCVRVCINVPPLPR